MTQKWEGKWPRRNAENAETKRIYIEPCEIHEKLKGLGRGIVRGMGDRIDSEPCEIR
jgi:hypothetical protein